MPIVVSPAAAMPVEVSSDVAAVRSTTAAAIRSAAATRLVAVAVLADRSAVAVVAAVPSAVVVAAVARAAAVAATADTDKFYRLANQRPAYVCRPFCFTCSIASNCCKSAFTNPQRHAIISGL